MVLELDLNNIVKDDRYVASFYSAPRMFFLKCLCAMLHNENLLIYCKEGLENIDSSKKLKFVNKVPNVAMKKLGVQQSEIVEKAAIGMALLIMPLYYDFLFVEVTNRTEGADYIFYLQDGSKIVLESKGDFTKYKCKSRYKEGKKQINVAFKKFGNSMRNGIVSVSCFLIGKHYFVELAEGEG